MYYNISNLTLTINEEIFELSIPSHVNTINIYEGLYLKINSTNNIINISLLNTGTKKININNLSLTTFVLDKDDYDWYLNFHEDISKDIDIHPVSSRDSSSYMFSMLFSEDYLNLILGFLSSKSSYNHIDILSKKNSLIINATYDFINQAIHQGEEFTLDPLFFSHDINYINLITSYCAAIKNTNTSSPEKLQVFERRKEENILFTNKLSSYILRNNFDPIKVKINGETLYPIDITSALGRHYIMDKVKRLLLSSSYIEINNVMEYINIVRKYKRFNVYNYIDFLTEDINKTFPNAILLSKDVPFGLMLSHNFAYINRIKPYTSKIFSKPIYSFDMHFLIKTLLLNSIYIYDNKYSIKNSKVKELLEIITSSIKPEYISLEASLELASSLNNCEKIIPYIYKENIFSFLVKGESGYYIAVFNLSKRRTSFHWDLSQNLKEYISGNLKELFTGETFEIRDNKLKLKNLNSMDCYLLKLS
ncbi:hypothetical protein [Clostridium sp.]|uniref:hypothetical protein n=1 Tax=Clostridium sp. TaxID=1506 RepID=UPI0034642FBB